MPERQNTRLESEGAEFLVLGNLLVSGVSCFKACTNFQGYDLVAVNADTSRSARIQVKSRWATNYDRSSQSRTTIAILSFTSRLIAGIGLAANRKSVTWA